jgi:hypothetical protein
MQLRSKAGFSRAINGNASQVMTKITKRVNQRRQIEVYARGIIIIAGIVNIAFTQAIPPAGVGQTAAYHSNHSLVHRVTQSKSSSKSSGYSVTSGCKWGKTGRQPDSTQQTSRAVHAHGHKWNSSICPDGGP